MKIIAISPLLHKYPNETEIVIRMFEEGLPTYHLRKPFYKYPTMISYLKTIPTIYHNRIVIHSHHRLIKKFDLQGVHYTRIHLESNFRNWWNEKRLASSIKRKVQTASCKKLAELGELGDRHYSYVFLSPIFDTLTGGFQSGYYEHAIKTTLQRMATRVVAMGGIDITKIERVQDLGFYGMALNNCLWEKEDPVKEYKKIIDRSKELGIILE